MTLIYRNYILDIEAFSRSKQQAIRYDITVLNRKKEREAKKLRFISRINLMLCENDLIMNYIKCKKIFF